MPDAIVRDAEPRWPAVLALVVLLIEANALGLLGGTGPGPTRKPLESHKHTIIAGFVLWAVLFAILIGVAYSSSAT